MTEHEFRKLPNLVFARHVQQAAGYNKATLAKMIECCVLKSVMPKGTAMRRFQKIQLAQLIGMAPCMERDQALFRGEPLLLSEKAVLAWTGFSRIALARIVAKKGLRTVTPAGLTNTRYDKREIAALIGFGLGETIG